MKRYRNIFCLAFCRSMGSGIGWIIVFIAAYNIWLSIKVTT